MTVEKIEKLDERVRALELSESHTTGQLGRVVAHLESEVAHFVAARTDLGSSVETLKAMLIGNGEAGHAERIRLLESAEKKREARERYLILSVLALAGKLIYDLIANALPGGGV